MWKQGVLPLVIFMGLSIPGSAHGDAQKVFNPANGHFYQRIDTAMAWDQARQHCESQGGYLATITSPEENGFLLDFLLGPQVASDSVWLGATDLGTEGVWEWVNGEFWGYSNWSAEQLNEYGENYLAVSHLSDTANWHDATGAESFPFVCEWGELDSEGDPEAPNLEVTYDYESEDDGFLIKISWTQVANAHGYYLYADFSNGRPFDGTFEYIWDFGSGLEIQIKYDFSYDLDAYVAVRAYHQTIGSYSKVIRIGPFFPIFASFIHGKISNGLTGAPIEGAEISAPEILGFAISLPDGSYSMIVDPGTGTVSVEAPGYLPVENPGVLVGEFDAVELDFALLPLEAVSPTISVVDIRANDQDGPVNVLSGEPVSISGIVSLVDQPDEMADWWIAVNSGFGFFFYSELWGWQPEPRPYKQASASHVEETNFVDLFLPTGRYTFYFAVDGNADGLPDATWWDAVDVEVE